MSGEESDPFDEDFDPEVDPDGYATGFTSGEDEEQDSYFGNDLDLDGLLKGMAEPMPGDGNLQPYQILRQQRNQQHKGKNGRGRKKQAVSDVSGSDDGDDEAWQDGEAVELSHTSEPKRKKNKKGGKSQRGGRVRRGPRQMELPEHISRMVGHANLLYASNKYQQAVDLLLEVIRQVPNLSDPYHTLGALHEVLDQPRQALNFYMIAAHMSGKDVSLWHKLAVMSDEQGFTRQAIYCWNKVLSKQKDDFDARFARARLFLLINEPWKAKQQYRELLTLQPGHPEVVKALVTLYHDYGQAGRAIEVLEEQLAQHYSAVDLTHINMLTDLYMAMGHFNNAIKLIDRSEQVMCKDEPLPIDLKVRRGACYAHMGDGNAAASDVGELLGHPVLDEEGESYQDLYMLVVQELSRVGMHELALPFIDKLRDAPGVLEAPDQWQMLADCYVKAARRDSAIDLFAHKLTDLGLQDERYLQCALSLAALYIGAGETAAAEVLLAHLDDVIAAHALALPEGQGQQLSLFLGKASLQLQLGQKEAFASSLLPHITALLEQAENNAAIVAAAKQASGSGAVPRELVKALKRRKMYARKGGRKGEGGGERDSVFKGYISRDRRKPHIVEADRAADQLLKRARAAGVRAGAVSGAEETEAEGDEDEGAGAGGAGGGDVGGDLPAELSALVLAATSDQEELPDLFGDQQLYGCFVDLVHVLLDLGQDEQAAALLTRAQAVAAYSSTTRDTTWWGPSATGGRGKGRPRSGRGSAAAAACDGNLSDWGGAGGAGGAAAGGSTADKREEVRLLKEGLKLMSAEVACRQGQVDEALKLLKTVLPKWPYSWRAWSLYCVCAGRLGRVQHWMKTVAALRAKHPDSLPLQVLAAHADNMSGEQGAAIQGYASALMQMPNEPLLLLCLGAAQIDAALQRHCKDRNTALLRGFAALHTYAEHRGPAAEAETAYNLGRAAHEVGLLHVAVAHYERVLQLDQEAAAADAAQQLQGLKLQQQEPQQQEGQQQRQQQQGELQVDGEQQQQQQQQGDEQQQQHQGAQQQQIQKLGRRLVKEAAHNLCLIYRGSGADDLARQIMRRYLTV